MRKYLYRILIELTNGKWTSFLLKTFVQSRFSRPVVPAFARVFEVDVEEAEYPLREYKTLHHFFTRKLKPGARPVDSRAFSVISPVDGVIEAFGTISEELVIKVKGKNYSLLDMLGKKEKVSKYVSGYYFVIYLSPSNYHRIHSPFSATVTGTWSLGNKSYPVNEPGLKYGRETLAKNFRKITELKHQYGSAALVKIGAMFVNSIEMTSKRNLEKGRTGLFQLRFHRCPLFEKDTFIPVQDLHSMEVKWGSDWLSERNHNSCILKPSAAAGGYFVFKSPPDCRGKNNRSKTDQEVALIRSVSERRLISDQ